MQMGRTGAIKVGRSSDVDRRRTEIQTGCPYEVRVLVVAPGQGHRETNIHQRMRSMRLRGQKGEWFSEAALGSIPDDIHDMITPEAFEMMNGDWWKQGPDPGPIG